MYHVNCVGKYKYCSYHRIYNLSFSYKQINEKIKFENEISDKVKIEFENDHERFVASVPEKFFLDAVDKAFEFTEINWKIRPN